MRLSISNIAWDVSEDEAVALLLKRYNIHGIDIAPGKYFAKPKFAKDLEIGRVRDYWERQGIQIVGMQALLFGIVGLNLFGTKEVQNSMLDHLNDVCRIGSRLGATRLVFGSPKNRNREALSDANAFRCAREFFFRLGDIAESHQVFICLEPNPTRYGCNFLTESMEAGYFVSEVGHPFIRMQLDTGTLQINSEDPEQILKTHSTRIGHIHASEPDLVPLGDGKMDHKKIAEVLRRFTPSEWVTIEMVAVEVGSHLTAIERALQVACDTYGRTE